MKFNLGIPALLLSLLLVGCAENIKINGTVTGLSEGEVAFQVTGTTQFGEQSDPITLNENGPFETTLEFVQDEAYLVAITTQPTNLVCELNSEAGIVTADVSIDITCSTEQEAAETEGEGEPGAEEFIYVTGTVLNLKQDITLINNVTGDTVSLTADESTFVFDQQFSSIDGFNISIVEEGHNCTVYNGEAPLVEGNDIKIECTLPFIGMHFISAFGSSAENEASFIPFVFHASEGVDYSNSYNDLDVSNLQISENDINLNSDSEAFEHLQPLNYSSFNYSLVILIDTSSSVSEAALMRSKEAAKTIINNDPTLTKGTREVFVLTFDDYVHLDSITEPLTNIIDIENAIDGIQITNNNSSSMNCPILQAASFWNDVYYHSQRDIVNQNYNGVLNYGSMVVFTDGVDTAAIHEDKCWRIGRNEDGTDWVYYEVDTTTDAFKAWKKYGGFASFIDSLNIYVLANGDEYESNKYLEVFAQPYNIHSINPVASQDPIESARPANAIEKVMNRIGQDLVEMDSDQFGLYHFSYISPNRSREKMKSTMSIKYTEASGNLSSFSYIDMETEFFVDFHPTLGFSEPDEVIRLEEPEEEDESAVTP